MLAGPEFDLLVISPTCRSTGSSTGALEAGRHVWSEKPMANSLEDGQSCSTWPAQERASLGRPGGR